MSEAIKGREVPQFLLDDSFFKKKGGRGFGSNMEIKREGSRM